MAVTPPAAHAAPLPADDAASPSEVLGRKEGRKNAATLDGERQRSKGRCMRIPLGTPHHSRAAKLGETAPAPVSAASLRLSCANSASLFRPTERRSVRRPLLLSCIDRPAHRLRGRKQRWLTSSMTPQFIRAPARAHRSRWPTRDEGGIYCISFSFSFPFLFLSFFFSFPFPFLFLSFSFSFPFPFLSSPPLLPSLVSLSMSVLGRSSSSYCKVCGIDFLPSAPAWTWKSKGRRGISSTSARRRRRQAEKAKTGRLVAREKGSAQATKGRKRRRGGKTTQQADAAGSDEELEEGN